MWIKTKLCSTTGASFWCFQPLLSVPCQGRICKLILPQGPSQIRLKELYEAWKHISLPSCLSGRVHRSKVSVIKTNLWSCQTSTDLHFKSGLSFEQTLSKHTNELQQEPSWIKDVLLSIQPGTTELWWIISAGRTAVHALNTVGGVGVHLKTLLCKQGCDHSSVTTFQDHYGELQSTDQKDLHFPELGTTSHRWTPTSKSLSFQQTN